MSEALRAAREFEQENKKLITSEERPVFHLTPQTGWLNDPNGFSFYGGFYHIFYQYNPYESYWGPMHWGHAVSKDLLRWTDKPAVLAPDMPYDSDGCYSGSAIEMPDGKHMLIYTGVSKRHTLSGRVTEIQTQNLAFGDGTDYVKFRGNPVIAAAGLPKGGISAHFRDPKIVRLDDETYRTYSVNWLEGSGGCVLQHMSRDGIHWKFKGILAKNDFRIGRMWECPDFFELGGKQILLASMQDHQATDLEYDNGNGTFWAVGRYDDAVGEFEWEHDSCIDNGLDFYAPQTVLAEDGRRVMIAWMQNVDTVNLRSEDVKWYGQMSTPRELTLRGGRIFQNPIRELETLRGECTADAKIRINCEKQSIEGVRGRILDLILEIEAGDPDEMYRKFTVNFAENARFRTSLTLDPFEGTVAIDRRFSGSRRAMIHNRTARLDANGGTYKIRMILDRFSSEIFFNDGEKAMSLKLETPQDADGISFLADGCVSVKVKCYPLKP